ncbi:restriction endonuclease subunit S [Flaviaesturariibacter aridisoli]|uniref:Restriction endonuclease subunit S n=1 Tax=Flaviaesturariibacter aridisoli TaxID=2545761 RepID=A0A4R4DRZ0_9BACT|nr:restriction endonuclease subunit S [Flaviaesturariibacter aridisoli]TCZ65184.1 restriction endonuclease subunit S [Flaviaesturariibacter aridisoli]
MELVEIQYKKTELGQIPEDWVECKFGDVFTGFSSGMTPYRGNPGYYKGSIPWITSGELKYNQILDTNEKITNEAVSRTNLKIIPKGTFLMAITGLEAAGTRGSCAITGINATTNQSCMALYPIKGKSLTEYLFHFYVRYGNEFAFKYCQGTKQQSYTGSLVKLLPIVLPPTLTEQKAIADALSDADALIARLKKLIAKKKAIKQGAMQQLLTPDHSWSVVSLSKLSDGKKQNFDDGDWIESEYITDRGIRLVQTGNIGVGYFIDKASRKYINDDSFVKLGCKEIVEGDLLICRLAEPAGRACILPNIGERKMITSVDVSIFRGDPKLSDRKFLSQLFTTDFWFSKVIERVGGTTHKRISRLSLGRIEFKVPPIEKQIEIGRILSDLDKEVLHLDRKLKKIKAIKQGMMQELLTGKTRLI